MALPDNIYLDLYVATESFPDSSQYEESQKVLGLIDQHGVRDRFKINYLDDLVGYEDIEDFYWMMNNPEGGRLPYLEYLNRNNASFDGYVGQKEIIDKLIELGLPQDNDDQPEN